MDVPLQAQDAMGKRVPALSLGRAIVHAPLYALAGVLFGTVVGGLGLMVVLGAVSLVNLDWALWLGQRAWVGVPVFAIALSAVPICTCLERRRRWRLDLREGRLRRTPYLLDRAWVGPGRRGPVFVLRVPYRGLMLLPSRDLPGVDPEGGSIPSLVLVDRLPRSRILVRAGASGGAIPLERLEGAAVSGAAGVEPGEFPDTRIFTDSVRAKLFEGERTHRDPGVLAPAGSRPLAPEERGALARSPLRLFAIEFRDGLVGWLVTAGPLAMAAAFIVYLRADAPSVHTAQSARIAAGLVWLALGALWFAAAIAGARRACRRQREELGPGIVEGFRGRIDGAVFLARKPSSPPDLCVVRIGPGTAMVLRGRDMPGGGFNTTIGRDLEVERLPAISLYAKGRFVGVAARGDPAPSTVLASGHAHRRLRDRCSGEKLSLDSLDDSVEQILFPEEAALAASVQP